MKLKTEKEIVNSWIANDTKPMVSILCITYNHEKHIKKTIEGFLMQNTNFKYEIVIHDDLSSDSTADIIKEYEKQYPTIIKAIYEKENLYSKRNSELHDKLASYVSGKFVALCEGDDYWIDKNKLQKQYDYLKKNRNCSLIITNGFNEDFITKYRSVINPYIETGVLSTSEVLRENQKLPPTCSMFFRSNDYINIPSIFVGNPASDRPIRFYLATIGYVYYLNEITCVHVYNVDGSFSQRTANSEYAKYIYEGMLQFYNNFNNYTNYKYKKDIAFVINRELYATYLRNNQKIKAHHTKYYKEYHSLIDIIKNDMIVILPRKVIFAIKRLLKK